MFQNDAQKVLTGKVRLTYVHLMAPHLPRNAQQGQQAKYSCTLLIPKGDVNTKADIDSSIEAAIQDGIAKQWKGQRPPQIYLPIYDGDGVRPNSGDPFGEECRGHWVMTASSTQKPEVVDLTGSAILVARDIYSGMYARVTIRFFAYENSGRRGVGCGLGNVQKLEDGEQLSGRSSAANDFGAAPAPVGGVATPTYGAAQPATPTAPMYAPPGQVPAYAPGAVPAPAYAPAPGYPAAAPAPAPAYAAPVAAQIDPITGKPIVGPVMGVG